MLFAFLADLISPDLLDRLHQMANDMKFIKNKACLRGAFLDDLDIGLPHIAADALEFACPFRPEILEKTAQGVFASFRSAPDQGL